MSKSRRAVLLVIALLLMLALPMTALASPTKWGAFLSSTVGNNAGGSLALRATPTGYHFRMVVQNLSSNATGVHLHRVSDGSIVVSLCGTPAPAALVTCTMVSPDRMQIEGDITSSLMAQWGVGGAAFRNMLNNSELYVNVHTVNNPGGEASGVVNPF
jgi:hypothetical protein